MRKARKRLGNRAQVAVPSESLSATVAAARLIEQAAHVLRLGRTDTVPGLLERAAVLAGADRSRHAAILALNVKLHHAEARLDAAVRDAKEAVAVFRELGDVPGEIAVRAQVAQLLLAAGNTSEALVEALAAMDDAERIVDEMVRLPVLVECLRSLAYVFSNLARHEEVIAFCERGAESARLLGDLVSEGVLLDCMGCAYGAMAYEASAAGEHERATGLVVRSIASSREAMMLARAGGHRRYEATALANVAEGLVQSGRPQDALALMADWPTDAPSNMETLTAHRLDTQGTISMALGRTPEAIEFFEAALRVASSSNLALVACEHLADACERSGDLAAALGHQKRVYALYKRVASEASQRSASVAAVRLETREARASLVEHRAIAEGLQRSNERLNRRADDLMRLSQHDPLTGLANRRRMDALLEERPAGFGIVMIDVDHFKAINDGWSHIVGDAVLARIGIVIGSCCRASDTAVRYGGDEFAILVQNGDERTTLAMAERVRADVADFDWNAVADGLSVSISVGCSSAATDGASSALASADRRLFVAKRGGRNRVAAADTPPPVSSEAPVPAPT